MTMIKTVLSAHIKVLDLFLFFANSRHRGRKTVQCGKYDEYCHVLNQIYYVDDYDVHDDRDYDKNGDNDENYPSRLGAHTSLRRCDSYWEEEPIKLSADDNRECYHNHQTTLR